MASDEALQQLARRLVQMQSEIDNLKASRRAPHLSHSTVEDGQLVFRDANGAVRQIIGRTRDGTFGEEFGNAGAPPRPNTPTIEPFPGGLDVHWSGTFVGDRPNDFSHVTVHLSPVEDFIVDPSNARGTLTRTGFLPIAPVAYVPHYAKLVAVNRAGVTSEPSIVSGPMTPTKVDAPDIVANAIRATHVDAGAIDARHLAAVIALIDQQVIVGDPNAQRLVLDALAGLVQYSSDGTPTLQLGANPAGGNFFTIVDPDDTTRALATISNEGIISASGFNLTGSLDYNGEELGGLLGAGPRGIVRRAERTTNTATTTTEIGALELVFTAQAGRMYRLSTSRIAVGPNKNSGFVRMRATLDGSRPVVTDPPYKQAWWDGANSTIMDDIGNETDDVQVGILLTVQYFYEAAQGSGPNCQILATETAPAQMWVEDVGPIIDESGMPSDGGGGGGSTPPPPVRRTRQWLATWSRAWRGNGSLRATNGEMVQGYYDASNGDNHSAFGFDDANIRAELAGATIENALLYVYSPHWYFNSGGAARIRTHNSGPTNTYPGVSGTRWNPKMPKPGGVWVTLGAAVGNEFKNGQTRGFALDARDVARNLIDYGKILGVNSNQYPTLQITYTK